MQNTEKLNEEYDLDDMFMSKAVQKESSAKQAERDRQKAIDVCIFDTCWRGLRGYDMNLIRFSLYYAP